MHYSCLYASGQEMKYLSPRTLYHSGLTKWIRMGHKKDVWDDYKNESFTTLCAQVQLQQARSIILIARSKFTFFLISLRRRAGRRSNPENFEKQINSRPSNDFDRSQSGNLVYKLFNIVAVRTDKS